MPTLSSVLSRSFRRKLSMQSLKHFSTRELYIRKLHDRTGLPLEAISYVGVPSLDLCMLVLDSARDVLQLACEALSVHGSGRY